MGAFPTTYRCMVVRGGGRRGSAMERWLHQFPLPWRCPGWGWGCLRPHTPPSPTIPRFCRFPRRRVELGCAWLPLNVCGWWVVGMPGINHNPPPGDGERRIHGQALQRHTVQCQAAITSRDDVICSATGRSKADTSTGGDGGDGGGSGSGDSGGSGSGGGKRVRFAHTLTLHLKHNRWCGRLRRAHKSNNILLVAHTATATFYQSCHDPECRAVGYRYVPALPFCLAAA